MDGRSRFRMASYNGKKSKGCDYTKMFADMLPDLIKDEPMSVIEMADATGRCHGTCMRVVKSFHKEKKIHIARWRRGTSGPITALFIWGEGEDAPRPKPFTNSQKGRRYRRSQVGRSAAKTYRTKKALEVGNIAVIDPILAAIVGLSGVAA